MAEEYPDGHRHGEHELPVREIQRDLIRQVLGEQQRSLLAATWTEIESLARKRPEVVMTTRRVRAPDAGDAQSVVAARQKPIANVADAIQPEHAVPGRVRLIVDVAELSEMSLEDRVELIATTGDVAVT